MLFGPKIIGDIFDEGKHIYSLMCFILYWDTLVQIGTKHLKPVD